MTDEQIDLLAQTMFAGFYSDMPAVHRPPWDEQSTLTRGNWRRAARAAARTLEGNMHWLMPEPPPKVWVATCGVCSASWSHPGEHNPNPKGTFCPDCRTQGRMASGVLNWEPG